MSEAKSRAEPGAAVESSSPDREEEQQPVRGRCSREGGALRSRSRSREEGAEGRAAREAADGEAGDPRASAASSTASKDNDGAKTTTTTQKNKSKKKKSKKNSRLKFYRQLKRIGKGSYGVVDLVRGKDNRLYVMKVVQNTEGKVTAGGYESTPPVSQSAPSRPFFVVVVVVVVVVGVGGGGVVVFRSFLLVFLGISQYCRLV